MYQLGSKEGKQKPLPSVYNKRNFLQGIDYSGDGGAEKPIKG